MPLSLKNLLLKFEIDFISATRYDYALFIFLSVKTEKHMVRSKKKYGKYASGTSTLKLLVTKIFFIKFQIFMNHLWSNFLYLLVQQEKKDLAGAVGGY